PSGMRAISFCIVCFLVSWFEWRRSPLAGNGSSRLVDGEVSVAAAPGGAAQSPHASDGITVHRPLQSKLVVRAGGRCGGNVHPKCSSNAAVESAAQTKRAGLRGWP